MTIFSEEGAALYTGSCCWFENILIVADLTAGSIFA